jgi:Cu(I)/Ag(I) efflux system membrane fusion protein
MKNEIRSRAGRYGAAAAALTFVAALAAGCRERPSSEADSKAAGHVHGRGASSPATAASAEIAYYTCPMHPSVRSADPGACPICGMKLQPVTRGEAETGVILIDQKRRQTIGVTTATAQVHDLVQSIRAVGKVVFDETRLSDVALKIGGWVGELHVDTLGQRVRQGEPLFTLYSPQLYAAQEELRTAVQSQKAARQSGPPGRVDYLVEAARQRLRLWDLQPTQIDQIVRAGKAMQYLPILSPANGYVIEKNIVAGASVEPGARLYRIADLEKVWIEAEIYESDLPLVNVGDAVRISLPYQPGWESAGRVSLVYPYLDDTTRTGKARIELVNAELTLKPDMYANVELSEPLGPRLAVPDNAVLYAGDRSFVFVDLGEGRLEPRAVKVGRSAGALVEILEGLDAGEVIVTSGNFLVAAESRLKVDMEHWK